MLPWTSWELLPNHRICWIRSGHERTSSTGLNECLHTLIHLGPPHISAQMWFHHSYAGVPVDVIVEGCNSQELKRKILEKDRSLTEIEALGESLESVIIQEKEMKVGTRNEMVGQSEVCRIRSNRAPSDRRQDRFLKRFVTGRSKGGEKKPGTVCYACGRYGHISTSSECPAIGQECRKCKKTGHFESVCRKRSLYAKAKSPPKKVQAIDDISVPIVNEAKVEPENSNKVYYTFYTGSQANVFNCNIGGTMVEVFIDSGSELNLITTETWEQMKAQRVVVSNCKKGSDKILKAYGSTKPLHILGTFEAKVEIGKQSADAIFFVTLQLPGICLK
ncbi:uncharacterized protein LOC129751868 [Uranotaenia lowii]|uniref:uncharacterized protein LOC129751868 n=1 Tax=Uranotaenia lowii TaxID=190385 RepID=UPI00247A776C|nr:uncharacterized protein LOC129751868 [Uranotaenia lowii]